jgi:hypothetical protein
MRTLVLSWFLLVTACDENYCIHLFQSKGCAGNQTWEPRSDDSFPNLVHPMYNRRKLAFHYQAGFNCSPPCWTCHLIDRTKINSERTTHVGHDRSAKHRRTACKCKLESMDEGLLIFQGSKMEHRSNHVRKGRDCCNENDADTIPRLWSVFDTPRHGRVLYSASVNQSSTNGRREGYFGEDRGNSERFVQIFGSRLLITIHFFLWGWGYANASCNCGTIRICMEKPHRIWILGKIALNKRRFDQPGHRRWRGWCSTTLLKLSHVTKDQNPKNFQEFLCDN